MGLPKWDKVRTIILCDSASACLGQRGLPESFVFQLPNKCNAIGSNRYIKIFSLFIGLIESKYAVASKKTGKPLSFTNSKNYTPHCFRGSINSLLLNRAILNESSLQQYLGWTKNILTTVQNVHYTKFDENAMWNIANEIEKLFSGREMAWKPNATVEQQEDADSIINSILAITSDEVGINENYKEAGDFGTYKYAEEVFPINEE